MRTYITIRYAEHLFRRVLVLNKQVIASRVASLGVQTAGI